MEEVEHSAKARPADNLALRPILVRRAGRPLEQLPAQPLMDPLGMVVRRWGRRVVFCPSKLHIPSNSCANRCDHFPDTTGGGVPVGIRPCPAPRQHLRAFGHEAATAIHTLGGPLNRLRPGQHARRSSESLTAR